MGVLNLCEIKSMSIHDINPCIRFVRHFNLGTGFNFINRRIYDYHFIYIYSGKASIEVGGKSYIGKTKLPIEKRFKIHIRDSRKERCKNRPLYRAMNKYGIENFIIDFLEETDTPEKREIYYVKKYNTYGSK